MSVSYFRLPVPQRAITKPLVWRLWKENRLVVRHAAMIRDYWVSSFSRSQSGCNMCKVSFADNSETVGHTGIARLCCSQRTARTRTDCLLLQEEAPASSGGGGCHWLPSCCRFWQQRRAVFLLEKVKNQIDIFPRIRYNRRSTLILILMHRKGAFYEYCSCTVRWAYMCH